MPIIPTKPQNSFGSGWSCVDDLTMPSVMATGNRSVSEAIARRWQTPRGGLIDDPNYGYDLSDFVNDDLKLSDLGRIANLAGAEARKDERVLTCAVTIELTAAGELRVTANVKTATGPFQLVLAVSQVSVRLLSVTNQ